MSTLLDLITEAIPCRKCPFISP